MYVLVSLEIGFVYRIKCKYVLKFIVWRYKVSVIIRICYSGFNRSEKYIYKKVVKEVNIKE